MLNETISHFKIIRKLGEGGMGEIYLAEDIKLNRTAVIKCISPRLITDEDSRRRFMREAQAAARLNHPNIVTVYELGEHADIVYIAMEYIDGETLRELITQQDLPILKAINFVIEICAGLSRAHKAGIVHRDLKPENIMIDRDGWVKILDFGLAKLRDRSTLTKAGFTMGTPAYMSPEQVRGEALDERTDIFSTGVLLYELITGLHPFEADYEQAFVYSIIHEQPEPLARYKREVRDGFAKDR
ncbi:MAG: serine/threonine protein kinase [bacterium]